MKKILLIEDDFYIRSLYKTVFEKNGFIVTEAADGKEALQKIKEDSFNLIILDLMLPGISGMEVLKSVRKFSQTPIYILTNIGNEETLQEAMASGAQAYFVKVNYTPNQLVAAIKEKEAEKKQPPAS